MVNAGPRSSEIGEPGGYTLVELLVVLAMLAMLAGLVIPRFRNSLDRSQLRHAAQQLAGDLTEGRLLAIDQGCNYVARHQLAGRGYSLRPQHEILTQPSAGLAPGTSQSAPDYRDRKATTNSGTTANSGANTQAAGGALPLDPQRADNTIIVNAIIDNTIIDDELPAGVVFRAADHQRQTVPPSNELVNGDSRYMPERLGNDASASSSPSRTAPVWTDALVFYPDGRSESAAVTLQGNNGYIVHLTVRGLTGGVSVGRIERLTNSADNNATESRRSFETATEGTPDIREPNHVR